MSGSSTPRPSASSSPIWGPRLKLLAEADSLADLVERFASRYTNPATAALYRRSLPDLFASAGVSTARMLRAEDLIGWADPRPRLANNTIRQRVSLARTFLRWCARLGLVDATVIDEAFGPQSPLSRVHRTYGKVQDRHPARWLAHEEAGRLIAACQDGTDLGLRDELVIRLGLLSMRASEIGNLTFGEVDANGDIAWTGKSRKPRTATGGPGFLAALTEYQRRYRAGMGRSVRTSDPIFCTQAPSGPNPVRGQRRPMLWGVTATQPRRAICQIVNSRAALAGLGHVAPHDLRRTAAGLLHDSLDADGGHRFDLLDITRVLDHADPACTMRSYLQPRDNGVKRRASAVLDF